MDLATAHWLILIVALRGIRNAYSTPDESQVNVSGKCIPTSTNPVEIRDCNITTIDADCLAPFGWITTLDMSFNRQFDFPPDGRPFLHHARLMFYHCESCGITTIHERTFAKLRQLMVLNLRSNEITTVHTDAFSYCNLGYLNLANNQIEQFNKWHKLEKVHHLMTLDISGNRRLNLNDLAGDFRSLSWVLCRECGLSRLDGRWFKLAIRLEKLDLANNFIEIVPKDNFIEHHRLTNMNLNHNPLQFLDFANERLEILSCVGCNLTKLTIESVQYLPSLKSLDLRNNKIATVNPLSLFHNKELKKLLLDNNLLVDFPEEVLRTTKSLETLCLDNNYFQPNRTFTDFKLLYKSMKLRNDCAAGPDHRYHFERFTPDFLEQGISLYSSDLLECSENVNISYRNVVLIEPMVYANCALLKSLEMDGNPKFLFYQNHPFLHSESLEVYSCKHCGITALYSDTFTELPELKSLLLQENPLKRLYSVDIFERNPKLEILRLDHNQLQEMSALILHNQESFKTVNVSHNSYLSFNLSLYFIDQPSVSVFHGVSCAITQITRYSFSMMPNLMEIYLSENPIATIDSEAFRNNQQLRILYLARTQLRVFPVDAVNHLQQLAVLCLYGLDRYEVDNADNKGNNAELSELFSSRKLHCKAGEWFISRLVPTSGAGSQGLPSEVISHRLSVFPTVGSQELMSMSANSGETTVRMILLVTNVVLLFAWL
ncbi:leucine-rich repeat-containing G-protein coupled receptor 6-like [Toxorhynchites rutilus septentrionalis]|uniref:leucine-rich repeat-containing G-protein coupled receptor 6-like n=1 Tax=Toxorhynchites rutilus septentrionalis TaxID=329112 RepID=UPI00247ADCCD|nr:leucine-rich repeat-containing G-protein coupled receptor 6-like [Toxorhynchites rutilus septentrionalis]